MLLLLDVLLFVTLLAIGGLCVLLFMRIRRFTDEAARMPVLSDDLASAMTSCRTVLENMQRTASRHGMALTEKTQKAEQSVEELKFLLARAERALTHLEGKLPADLAPINQTTERPQPTSHQPRGMNGYQTQSQPQNQGQTSSHSQALDERAMLTQEDTPLQHEPQTAESYAARRRQPSPQELTAQAELARESALSELQKQYKTDYQFDEKTVRDEDEEVALHRQERAFLSAEEHRLPFSTPNRPMGSAIKRLAKPMQDKKDDAVVMPGRDGGSSMNGSSSAYAPQQTTQKPAALRTTAAAYSQSASRFGGQSYNGESSNTARKLTTDAEQELRRALKESL